MFSSTQLCEAVCTAKGRWVSNFVGLAITAVLGEYLCLRREMQDIPLGAPLAVLGRNSDRTSYTRLVETSHHSRSSATPAPLQAPERADAAATAAQRWYHYGRAHCPALQ